MGRNSLLQPTLSYNPMHRGPAPKAIPHFPLFLIGTNPLVSRLLCLLFSTAVLCQLHHNALVTCESRVFDLRLSSDGAVDKQVAARSSVRRYGDADRVDYFRLLESDGDYLIIGAADSVHNISVDTFELQSAYEWKPTKRDKEDCGMKNYDKELCRNYIRVLNKLAPNRLLICGTNSFKPRCRILDTKQSRQRRHSSRPHVVSDFDGIGIAPHDPLYNNSFNVDHERNLLFAATVADFGGRDTLIHRRNLSNVEELGLRTERYNKLLFNEAQFVGSIQSEEYVYFFFRETAVETMLDSSPTTYSRVARVCKHDRGGPQHEAEWTSFVKARLNCSIASERKPFHFDEIVSISGVVIDGEGEHSGGQIVYATFVSEYDFLRHSVICAFDVRRIDALFRDSDLLSVGERPWRHKRTGPMVKVGQCQPDSRLLSGSEVSAMREYPLMANTVPSIFPTGAVGIYDGVEHYNNIAVLGGVEFADGVADVVYVATNQGSIFKLVNLHSLRTTGPVKKSSNLVVGGEGKVAIRRSTSPDEKLGDSVEDPLVRVAAFRVSNLPIRRLLISKRKYLIAVTDTLVYRLPLHQCESYASCDECVGSRDPHCVWNNAECIHRGPNENKQRGNKAPKNLAAYQDVLQRKGRICPTPPTTTSTTPPTTTLTSMIPAAARGHQVGYTSGASDFTSTGAANSFLDKTKSCKCEREKNSNKSKSVCDCESGKSKGPSSFEMADRAREGDSLLFPVPSWVLVVALLATLQLCGILYFCCKICAGKVVPGGDTNLGNAATLPSIYALSKSGSLLEVGNYGCAGKYQHGSGAGGIISAYAPTYSANGDRKIARSGSRDSSSSRLFFGSNVKRFLFPFSTCRRAGAANKDTSSFGSACNSGAASTSSSGYASSNGESGRNSALMESRCSGHMAKWPHPAGLTSGFSSMYNGQVMEEDVRIRLDGSITPTGTMRY